MGTNGWWNIQGPTGHLTAELVATVDSPELRLVSALFPNVSVQVTNTVY